jgi:hypothetical protein
MGKESKITTVKYEKIHYQKFAFGRAGQVGNYFKKGKNELDKGVA